MNLSVEARTAPFMDCPLYALDYTHQAIEGWTFGNNIWIRASDDSTASVDLP
jgi:hypothetical protein